MPKRKTDYFYTEPLRERVFYYIFVEGGQAPTQKHYSLQSAKTEAKRLAKRTQKETFILQAYKSYKPSDIVETNFLEEPERPSKLEKEFMKSFGIDI